jgi:hypothetical protein
LLVIPLSIGAAILRYRLWDVDLIINRTLAYGCLSAAHVVVYFGGVAATEMVFRGFTGCSKRAITRCWWPMLTRYDCKAAAPA